MTITDSNIRLTGKSNTIRCPAVAGMFYPQDPAELRNMLSDLLDEVDIDIAVPKAIIVPHAGYIYSGPIAAKAYASLIPANKTIKRVILLGPAHRVFLKGLALPSTTGFSTPLGVVDIDVNARKILSKFPQVTVMDNAHSQEHSLEVHLPFLQMVLESFTLVPLVVGDTTSEDVAQVLSTLWGGEETLIVISSDLSHYHDYETACKIDATTSDSILKFQIDAIGPHQACGCMPLRGFLSIAKQHDMQIHQLDLRNSGDTAGTHDRVVGYGAYAVHNNETLSIHNRKLLLNIAYKSIKQGYNTGVPIKLNPDEYQLPLCELRATFVTLKIEGKLRGCIGTTQAISPLINSVSDSAFKAAFKDPRFDPLNQEEFDQIELSISVLSVPAPITFASESELLEKLTPGRDGLIIEKGGKKATFLPAVWETLPEPREFLAQLKLKAGIAKNQLLEKAWCYHSESFSNHEF